MLNTDITSTPNNYCLLVEEIFEAKVMEVALLFLRKIKLSGLRSCEMANSHVFEAKVIEVAILFHKESREKLSVSEAALLTVM